MNEYLTPEQARSRIKHYCAYQERSHQEVKDRLYSFGLNATEVDDIISELIQENFLNEERFAQLYAGSKFRLKQWGRNKIKQHLKLKNVSDYCIRKGLQEIDETEYRKVFQKLLTQKSNTLKSEKNIFIKKRKIKDFLLQRGFESSMIHESLQKL